MDMEQCNSGDARQTASMKKSHQSADQVSRNSINYLQASTPNLPSIVAKISDAKSAPRN